jgi:hypothetical protein
MTVTALLDLDRRLAGDAGGWERDTLLELLRERRRASRRELDKGLSPERYAALSSMVAALDAAIEIVPLLWSRLRVSEETSISVGR